ncbi:hypothetical protein CEE69_24185 [Rhodopirellula bahusiensis]|uniref:Uncharacterized protein n=1 Tax=Rhodopirellula bahusiensis TaxID=2014065 RepID=A0A2G1W193_9BACT|nr:hypothetical protein CEE69_24185 [Rhodopirellula bahusiensis]
MPAGPTSPSFAIITPQLYRLIFLPIPVETKCQTTGPSSFEEEREMKRNLKATVAMARSITTQITRRSRTMAAIAIGTASVALLAPAAMAQGEHIVSSQVISDTVVGSSESGGCASGDCGGASGAVGVQGREYGQPDLFYNYYTQGPANAANAQMYVSPVPVPPNVGQTYLTYQPLYPHEMLYWHKDRYHNYYDNGRGMNRTRAIYYSPPVRQAASNFYWNTLRLPR